MTLSWEKLAKPGDIMGGLVNNYIKGIFGSDRSPVNANLRPISPPSQNHITAFINTFTISPPSDRTSIFHLSVIWRQWYESSEGGGRTHLKAVIWLIWRWWYESSEGGDMSHLKAVIGVIWRRWYESSEGGDMSHLKVVIWDMSRLKAVIWVIWRRWYESSEGGDMSHPKAVMCRLKVGIWAIWRWCIQRALRGHSESTYRVLREQSEIKKQSDFAIPSEPKILRLVFQNISRIQVRFSILCWG